MITTIECLPTELWMDIFSYLEAHQLLRAFADLNHHFDQMLASEHVLFHGHFDKCNRNPHEYTDQPYWPVSVLHRVVSLRPIVPRQLSHLPEFLRWHAADLLQLKSLTLKLRGREIPPICDVLPQLNTLRVIAIDCVPNQDLLDAILAIPNVRTGRLTFSRPVRPIHTDSIRVSSMEVLDIQLEDTSRGLVLKLLLSHMPRLRQLRMKSTDIYVKNCEWPLFEPSFILPNLRAITMQCSANYSLPVFFQSLHHNLPAVQSVVLDLNFDFIDAEVVNHLLYHWWPALETIEKVVITMRCRNSFARISATVQANLDDLRAALLALNQQFDRSIETKWTDRFHLDNQLIDIFICQHR